MADASDPPPDPIPRDDRRRERNTDRKDRTMEERSRDRDPRERRDERSLPYDRDERQARRDYHEKQIGDDEPASSGQLTSFDRRDRDKDYKRRKSCSPPPSLHRNRERQCSPSRPSPSHKRYRREEEYEATRRGTSPRSSTMLSSDKTSGYDRRHERLQSYDRVASSAGRSSAKERSYTSYVGSHSEYPDFRRSGLTDGRPWHGGAPRREGLMTYKQFIADLEDDILPAEAESRYEEYKNKSISTQRRMFFDQNKDEDWLRDKYDPSRLDAVKQLRDENCRAIASVFIVELEEGTLDMSRSANNTSTRSLHDKGHGLGEETDDVVTKSRSGWGPVSVHESDAIPITPPFSSDARQMARYITQAYGLIKKLDAEKGIEGNILTLASLEKEKGEKPLGVGESKPVVLVRSQDQVKRYEGLELLNVALTYLWRVHSVDYYGMKEYIEPPKEFCHVRTEGKGNDDMTAAAEWEKQLDATWEARLQREDPLDIRLARKKLEAATIEGLDPHVRKIKDEKYGWKYGCGAKGCTKLFHGSEYVYKHLKLKHYEIINEIVSKVQEELYFENYMSDPDAPWATPSVSQSVLRDQPRKQRPGVSGTVGAGFVSSAELAALEVSSGLPRSGSRRGSRGVERVDHGNKDNGRMEKASDEERHDREHSPYRNIPLDTSPTVSDEPYDVGGSSGPYERGHSDAALFNSFGVSAPPAFGSDLPMAPPILMPVPGAGPLGPFVPAPPEVAMRLMREQGAPPFHHRTYDESSGGSQGRKRWPKPVLGGVLDTPPVILPVVPAPWRMQSYNDLDHAEDEVTVIDYRTL